MVRNKQIKKHSSKDLCQYLWSKANSILRQTITEGIAF
jgi:hypothetical protein